MNLVMSSVGIPNREMLDLKRVALAEVFFNFSMLGWKAREDTPMTDREPGGEQHIA